MALITVVPLALHWWCHSPPGAIGCPRLAAGARHVLCNGSEKGLVLSDHERHARQRVQRGSVAAHALCARKGASGAEGNAHWRGENQG
jgi:hypothetical protein